MISSNLLFTLALGILLGILLFTPANYWSSHIGVFFIVLALIVISAIFLFTSDPKTKIKRKEKLRLEETEEEAITIPVESYHDFDEFQPVALTSKAGKFINKEHDVNHYQKLLSILEDSIFLEKYVLSLKTHLNTKKQFYKKILKEKNKELSQIEGQNGLSIFANPKDENAQSIKNLINECEDILDEINKKLISVDRETVRKSLLDAIHDPKRGLTRLVERDDIKNHLCEQIISFSNKPSVFSSGFQHLILTGDPGVGKTTVAQIMAHVYCKSGILIRDRCFEITNSDLTTAYVDASAGKTRNVLYSGLESVIFLDEAYSITPENKMFAVSHGEQAVTEIVNFLDKMLGTCVFIAAGYKEEIYRFVKANKGNSRRFPHQLHLEHYSVKALCKIFLGKITIDVPLNYNLLYSCILEGNKKKCFPEQGGDMLNIANRYMTKYFSMNHPNSDEILLETFNGHFDKYEFQVE